MSSPQWPASHPLSLLNFPVAQIAIMSDGIGNSVCVVGTGVMGLMAPKTLPYAGLGARTPPGEADMVTNQEGFDVVAYERRSYVGGLWHATMDKPQASVLPETFTNGSKWLVCRSKFWQNPRVLIEKGLLFRRAIS